MDKIKRLNGLFVLLCQVLSNLKAHQMFQRPFFTGKGVIRDLHSAALWQKKWKICSLRHPKLSFCGCGIIKIAKLLFILLENFVPINKSKNNYFGKR